MVFPFLSGQLKVVKERLTSAEKEKEREVKQTAAADPRCSGCGQLKQELDTALRVLNDQSCAKYGELLRQNFTLTQKVS